MDPGDRRRQTWTAWMVDHANNSDRRPCTSAGHPRYTHNTDRYRTSAKGWRLRAVAADEAQGHAVAQVTGSMTIDRLVSDVETAAGQGLARAQLKAWHSTV